MDAGEVGGEGGRAEDRDRRPTSLAVEVEADIGRGIDRRQGYALRRLGPVGGRGEGEGARLHLLVPRRRRHAFVDEPPLDRSLAARAFLGRAEEVGTVAADLSLSVRRVSPPVPGNTASSGTSGNDTDERRSSISAIQSHASASS